MKRSTSARVLSILLICAQISSFFTPAAMRAQAALPAAPRPVESAQAVNQPLSLSRAQSSYVAGTAVITLTLANDLYPSFGPDLTGAATVTDTAHILASFIITDDVNTLRGVSVETTLLNGTVLLAASGNPLVTGNTLTWALPDLAPSLSQVITFSVQTPAAGADFIALDSGAEAAATRWGQPVSTAARRAVIVPAGIAAPLTTATADADPYDADTLWKAAEFAQEPLAAFEMVRGLGYEAYRGSLRGTRGTLWSAAGNSLDLSSLLIALLRGAGVPARYRHGALTGPQAQTLLASMFPTPAGVAGSVPAGVPLANPLDDPALLNLAQDHWWVEAYLPGQGWTNLDPSFDSAQPGDVFATPATNGTDRIAEIPAGERHMLSLALVVEQYTQFPVNGAFLVESTPLTFTLPVAQVAGKQVILSQFVSDEISGGGPYTTRQITYQPYFGIDANNQAWLGDPYQDMISNFPLSTHATTAAWITYEVTAPDGSRETFERPVKDLLGADARLTGGTPSLAFDIEGLPFFTADERYINWVLPNDVPAWAYRRNTAALLPDLIELGRELNATLAVAAVPDEDFTQAHYETLFHAVGRFSKASSRSLALSGLEFAYHADRAADSLESGLLTRIYYSAPRLFAVGTTLAFTDTAQTTVDLRTTSATVLAAPGQAQGAVHTAQWLKGVIESELEGAVLEKVFGAPAVTTANVFEAMAAAGIEPVLFSPENIQAVALYPFSDDGKAYMTRALMEGKSVLAPSQPVMIGGAPALAWWEIDPLTGETISVGENGLHVSGIEYTFIENLVEDLLVNLFELLLEQILGGISGGWIGGPPGPVAIVQLAELLAPIGEGLSDIFFSLADVFALAGSDAPVVISDWAYLPAHQCPVGNCGIEQFFVDGLGASPVPLPEMLFTYWEGPARPDMTGVILPVSGSGGGAPAFSLALAPAASATPPNQPVSFQAEITANFSDDFVTIAYAPAGWGVEVSPGGLITAWPAPGAAAGSYVIQVVAQPQGHPELFDTAQHTVTVSALDTVLLDLQPEPNITVPMGAARFDAASVQTNDGEAEIGGAAYTVEVTNPGQTAHTYDVAVSGPPAGWVWLNGVRSTTAGVTLAPGQTARLGLYLQPADGSLPAPGVSYPINVTAVAGSLSAAGSTTFSQPSQAFNFLAFDRQPTTLYLPPNGSADFDLLMTNVGNAAGSFTLTTSLPPGAGSVSGLTSTVTLAVGESAAQTAAFTAGDLPFGMRFPLVIGSPAPDSYTQYAVADVQIVSELSGVVLQAAENAATVCTLGEPGLSASLESLALAMTALETACQSGECHPIPRDQAVSAAYSVALYAGAIHDDLDGLDALVAAADALATHSDPPAVTGDLEAIATAVETLDGDACAWSRHKPELRWTPFYGAALVNQTAPYTLTLANQGTLATTYALTVTLPGGTLATGQWALAPGESVTLPYNLGQPAAGLYDVSAATTVVGQGDISAHSPAKLNVVDRFVQVTAVRPTPDFVDPGSSSTTLFVEVANSANLSQAASAHAVISAPDGTPAYTGDSALTILVGAPRSYELEPVDTSGWAAGIYTVTVELLDANGSLIPDGSGYGYLGVGELLGVAHGTTPLVVPPGTFTVTTVITTELLTPGIVPQHWDQGAADGEQRLEPEGDSIASSPAYPGAESPSSGFAITRTQNTSAAFAYTGSWTTVSNIFASHLSDGSYAASFTPGNKATFNFSGPWVHIGFSKARNGGIAEIFVDAVSRGTVDLYNPVQQCFESQCASSVAFSGLGAGAHTLDIVVTGTAHPNANGVEVKIDYVDTWDGTLYPDGLYEQNNARVWVQPGTWSHANDVNASGGSYMNDGSVGNSQSAWFPFTGDSASFMAFARYDSHRVHVWVDGVWQGDVLIYAGQPVTRTYSFVGFGPGPHVMQIGTFRGEANIDAFITPAAGPAYEPPAYAGLVRYEEDHPALRYNGYDVLHRPTSWAAANAGQASEYAYMESNTPGDTVGFDFYGSWLEVGLRTRNRGGLAEVSIDGVSYGTINAYTPGEDVATFQFNVVTGTHTVNITVLGASNPPNSYNQVYLDYVEFWDGSPVADDFQNARRGAESGRVHVSNSVIDAADPHAIEGDFVVAGLPNSLSNVWYSFVGDAVTFYGLTVNDNASAEIYIDGVLTDTVQFDYPFSVQPFAFHYTGLPFGPHSIRVHNVWEMRVDGFAANQPDLPYRPIAEWWDNTPAGNGAPFFGTYGIAAGMAAGDVDADGLPEIVVTADDVINFGTLFVYRGDGADTGDGDPIKWTHNFGGGTFRTWVGTPALANLDGLPGAEIVVAAGSDLYAFHGDGSTYWMTGTVSIFETLSAPAIANLDLDPEPEIVVNVGNRLEVRAHDGELLWSTVFPEEVNPPVLADLNGDGLLDIVLTGWDDEVFVYDFNYGSPQLLWSATLASSMAGTFGAPAVADIDGQQPGGDPGPEVAFAHNGALTVLDGPDGSPVWSTPLEAGNPGGVSIADVDGDGEIEIVTGMRHEFAPGRFGKLYALNADGSLLWAAVAEDSTSANNASVLDLDGDGIYEVAWNGRELGFTLFSGFDGSIVFNEPLANSFTGTDYPLIADVDNDGQAEVVVAALQGLRVFGNGAVWRDARPLWNQHGYHITNINDDLSLPFSEPDSWEAHNTYRTQTHLRYPMLASAVALTHTVGLDNLTVLSDTFNLPPTAFNLPTIHWDYAQTWETPVITHSFDVRLSDLQPGETRLVAQSTSVDYTLPSGANRLELPPLFVSVPQIIALQPAEQAATNGATVTFDVTLMNPGTSGVVYTPTVTPLPDVTWGPLDPVMVPASGEVTLPLTAAVGLDAAAASLPFGVFVTTGTGGSGQAGGVLALSGPALAVEIAPDSAGVSAGQSAVYTLTVTNLEAGARTYDLSALGLAALDLPAQVDVAANSAIQVAFTAQAAGEGGNPFTVIATSTANGASAGDTAVITSQGAYLVAVTLDPAAIPSGPGVLTAVDVVVANLGSLPDTYDLSAALPAGWGSQFTWFGQPAGAVQVAPGADNAVTLQLLVSPAAAAAPGNYDVSVTASSAQSAGTGAGVVQVGGPGVAVAFTSGPASLPPNGSGVWQVTISNPGSAGSTFQLAAFGPLAAFATLNPDSVTLLAGQSQTVEVAVSGLDGFVAGATSLGIHARSTAQPAIQDEATADVIITALEGVEIAWVPAEQHIESGSADFTIVITNTGSVLTAFDLTITSDPAAGLSVSGTTLTLPAGSTATLLVSVTPPADGVYTITAIAGSQAALASDAATLYVGSPGRKLYLPSIFK